MIKVSNAAAVLISWTMRNPLCVLLNDWEKMRTDIGRGEEWHCWQIIGLLLIEIATRQTTESNRNALMQFSTKHGYKLIMKERLQKKLQFNKWPLRKTRFETQCYTRVEVPETALFQRFYVFQLWFIEHAKYQRWSALIFSGSGLFRAENFSAEQRCFITKYFESALILTHVDENIKLW